MQENEIIQDEKRDYLVRTLSRTKRKDYENYVINAIYHKLDRLDIKPVTQQYIKRSDGKYALVDLYFPQLNYGIECDEEYHLKMCENDMVRFMTMENMLDSVEKTKGFIHRRVKAYKNISSINTQISTIVDEINKLLIERKIEKWDININPAEIAIKKRMITVEDRLQFDTIISLSQCFGKEYKNMQRSFFNIGYNYYIWCPKLAIYIDGKEKAISNGWINSLSPEWDKIYESKETNELLPAKGHLHDRITFAKSQDVLGNNKYRFIGIFSYSEEYSSENKNVYSRIATSIELSQWLDADISEK